MCIHHGPQKLPKTYMCLMSYSYLSGLGTLLLFFMHSSRNPENELNKLPACVIAENPIVPLGLLKKVFFNPKVAI